MKISDTELTFIAEMEHLQLILLSVSLLHVLSLLCYLLKFCPKSGPHKCIKCPLDHCMWYWQVRTVHARVTAFAHPPAYTPTIFSPLAKGGRGRGRKDKVGVRQRRCATHNAMPKPHFAAPGAVCTRFLALSSGYCIWSRLCALLAQLVHHSSRHVSWHT